MSVVADLVAWASGGDFWWRVSFWIVVVGLLSAVPTAGAGLFDYVTIVEDERAAKTGMIHLYIMFSVIACFGIELVLRGGTGTPRGLALVSTLALDAAGSALVLAGGWYGGELVFGHGIGRQR